MDLTSLTVNLYILAKSYYEVNLIRNTMFHKLSIKIDSKRDTFSFLDDILKNKIYIHIFCRLSIVLHQLITVMLSASH